jgi:hypothetical protein
MIVLIAVTVMPFVPATHQLGGYINKGINEFLDVSLYVTELPK